MKYDNNFSTYKGFHCIMHKITMGAYVIASYVIAMEENPCWFQE